MLELLKHDLKPRDIITRKSLNNAIVVVMALGGSTNAVLHLIAIARCTPMPWLQCLFSTKASIVVWRGVQSVFPLDCFLQQHRVECYQPLWLSFLNLESHCAGTHLISMESDSSSLGFSSNRTQVCNNTPLGILSFCDWMCGWQLHTGFFCASIKKS